MSEPAEKRRIVIGMSGSIAAYKVAELARLYITRGYEVRVVMTQSAQEFISPLTMQSLTGNAVVSDFWDDSDGGMHHIELADWADVLVLAPATADLIAKLTHGFADSPVLAIALATKAPILVAPAMNVNMYSHVATRENITTLKARGVLFVDPEEGALACGWHGSGRLADPWEIFHQTRRALSPNDFRGKKIVISTGPTREAIDPVRFISNRSSGKMGAALAAEAYRRGAEVTLVHGPVKVKVPRAVTLKSITTAQELRDAMLSELDARPDIMVMAAAVADYRPQEVSAYKIKKKDPLRSIELAENPDILSELGQKRKNRAPLLVGFAVETGELDQLIDESRKKLQTKNADMIVGNFADEALDLDTNRVWLVDRHGRLEEVSTAQKSRVANKILDAILELV